MMNKPLPGFPAPASRNKIERPNSLRPKQVPHVYKPVIQPKAAPAAPPPYRPQPTPRVLQTKSAINKGPVATNSHRAASVTPQLMKPGTAVVNRVAPPVYRPNPAPRVLQRRTEVQRPVPPPGQRSPVQMKAQTPVRPLPANPTTSVVQRIVVIKSFKSHGKVTFKIRSSKDEDRLNTADTLIGELKDKGFARGWIGALREMVGNKKSTYTYNTLDELADDLAEDFPLMKESKKRKREERKDIEEKHKANKRNVKRKIARKGQDVRTGSFVGGTKLIKEISKTKVHKQNIKDLNSDFSLTKTGGKSLKLETGNIYQSQLAFSLANFGDDVRGAHLEGNYNRMNEGHGKGEIRTTPFIKISDRLRRTVVYREGAYKPGETVGKDLSTFENIRLPENTIPSVFRHMLVDDGKLKDVDEFDPTGPYAFSEIPQATKGEKDNNQLMNYNSYMVFDEVKKIDDSTVIGRNAKKMPKGTNLSTLSSYTTAYNNVISNHNQQTQNAFHLENFRISRATFGPFYDENKKPFVPSSPPGSPFNSDYGYGQTN